jgi:SAM-dependent methyltransferase
MTEEIVNQILTQLAAQPQPRWQASAIQTQKIQAELFCDAPKDGMMRVMTRMSFQEAPDLGEIDWDSELASFEPLDYPEYYLQPFHSVLGGWLSELAALNDRLAMEAVLENAHPRKSLGVREELAQLFPEQAKTIIDLGSGTGDTAAAIARRLPHAKIIALDASPFMIIVGRRQNQDVHNLHWQYGLAENTELPNNSVDAINISYVLHECPDLVKKQILTECWRILKPDGKIVITDSLNGELYSYRGFFEPYKEQWLKVNPDQLLTDAGFINIKACQPAYPIWTRVAQKPSEVK